MLFPSTTGLTASLAALRATPKWFLVMSLNSQRELNHKLRRTSATKKSLIFIIGFMTTFRLACDTNYIHKEAVIWVLPHFVHENLANVLNSCMCADDKPTPFVALKRSQEPRSRKLLRSSAEVVKDLLKKFTMD